MRRDAPLPIKAETWEMIQRLVAFDTTSRESNQADRGPRPG
jgi:hypothetical protein